MCHFPSQGTACIGWEPGQFRVVTFLLSNATQHGRRGLKGACERELIVR